VLRSIAANILARDPSCFLNGRALRTAELWLHCFLSDLQAQSNGSLNQAPGSLSRGIPDGWGHLGMNLVDRAAANREEEKRGDEQDPIENSRVVFLSYLRLRWGSGIIRQTVHLIPERLSLPDEL
jgi:hypothetical protein